MSFNKTVVVLAAAFIVVFDVIFTIAININYLYGGC